MLHLNGCCCNIKDTFWIVFLLKSHDRNEAETKTFQSLVLYELCNGGGTCLYNHTGDIIHAFVHGGCGIRTRTDAATLPNIAMSVVST